MKPRVTLKQIAEAMGLHVTTVSAVLRGNPHFSPATVSAVQEVAKGLGYVPDPMLSALAAYRSGWPTPAVGNTLACIGLGAQVVLDGSGYGRAGDVSL